MTLRVLPTWQNFAKNGHTVRTIRTTQNVRRSWDVTDPLSIAKNKENLLFKLQWKVSLLLQQTLGTFAVIFFFKKVGLEMLIAGWHLFNCWRRWMPSSQMICIGPLREEDKSRGPYDKKYFAGRNDCGKVCRAQSIPTSEIHSRFVSSHWPIFVCFQLCWKWRKLRKRGRQCTK